MNVLLVTNRVPFPANSGYPIVIHNTIKGLLDESASVSVFSLNPTLAYTDLAVLDDPLLKKISFEAVSIDNTINLWRILVSLFARKSWQISRFYDSAPVSRLKKMLDANTYDIIQLEGLFVMPYLNIIRQYSKAKIVYREHNIEHLLSGSSSAKTVSPLKRFYLNYMARRILRFELENLNRTDAVITINSSDQAHLVAAGCTVRLINFPVAIDTAGYIPNPAQIEYPSIFHIGSLDSLPASEGLKWFINDVWSDLKALNAGIKFHVAGRDIPGDLYAHEDNQFIIYDEIDDPRAFINSKQVMIVPLRTGSGMRVKIIEGMAMKKCIISTSLGAEGIAYEHGKNILIADNAGDFYKYVLQAITDRKMCEEIGENARRLVENEYQLKQNSVRLVSFYEDLVSK